MARQTVSTIFSNIAATVNQSPTPPADGGADFLLWLQFINRAQIEWAESYDWEELRKVYNPTISNASTATITLPANFRKLSGPVKYYDGSIAEGLDWPQQIPEQISLNTVTDRFFTLNGDPSNGYFLQWNPATLPSGASMSIPYFSMPTSLVSGTQYPVMPDTEFLVNRTVGYILEGRSDPRYQDQERKAREKLLQMVENADLMRYNAYTNKDYVKTTEVRKGFRIGRN